MTTQEQQQPKRLLTQRGALKRLNVCLVTFRKYRDEGLISPVGMIEDKFFVFDEDDVNALLGKLTAEHVPFRSRLIAQAAGNVVGR